MLHGFLKLSFLEFGLKMRQTDSQTNKV